MNLVGHLTELRQRPKPLAVAPVLRRAQQAYEIGAGGDGRHRGLADQVQHHPATFEPRLGAAKPLR